MTRATFVRQLLALLISVSALIAHSAKAEPQPDKPASTTAIQLASQIPGEKQAALETALSKMLSGATLEGSFTVTGADSDPTKLRREKYTLGEVKKLSGDIWLFPTRIQYGDKDVTLPIPVPIRWAGDTPVVVVESVDLPGFGAVSARVLFFNGHYAGYWQHGDHGGNLFGEIHSAGQKPATEQSDAKPAKPAR